MREEGPTPLRRRPDPPTIPHLRHNTKLVRRAAIRRLLSGRYHSNGIRDAQQLAEELQREAGILANANTLSLDLREMGAIKVRDAAGSVEWWVLPAFNINVESIRDSVDPAVVEGEVAHKIASHVIDIAPIDRHVYVLTEARAGHLVGYWMSWLSWPGIVYVQEQLDGCIIHCLSGDAANLVAQRLIGDIRHV